MTTNEFRIERSTATARFFGRLALASILGATVSAAADGESFWKRWSGNVKPEYFHGADEDVSAPGVSARAAFRKDESLNDRWTKTMVDYGFKTEITLAADSRANSEGSYAELFGGVKHTFSKIGSTGPIGDEAENPNALVNMTGAKEQVDLPFVHLSATTRFETDQTFENYQFVYGPRLGVIHTQQDRLDWAVLFPKLQTEFVGIEVLESRDFRDRGIEEDSYWRLGLEGDWRFEVGSWWAKESSFWRGMGLHTRVNYYRGVDMPEGSEAADFDESLLYAGGIHYRILGEKVKAGPFSLNFAYVTLSYGRRPPEVREQFGVRVGLAFSWNENGF